MFRIQAFVTLRVHVGTIKGEFRDVVGLPGEQTQNDCFRWKEGFL